MVSLGPPTPPRDRPNIGGDESDRSNRMDVVRLSRRGAIAPNSTPVVATHDGDHVSLDFPPHRANLCGQEVDMPHLSPTTLTTDEQRLILRATAGNVRDHTIISLALGTGLRPPERLLDLDPVLGNDPFVIIRESLARTTLAGRILHAARRSCVSSDQPNLQRRAAMRRFLTMALIVFAVVMGSVQLLSPAVQAAGGACGCRGTTPVCCHNCDGSFAYCARSYAFCPECAAP
jgi:integrase